mmetsp:Transcript_32857/g.86358  ORF Transcript_32857/g.86358 Transcript_32857/m.86358 type:complete len:243 (-) Transcript_32857:285-1013(-)
MSPELGPMRDSGLSSTRRAAERAIPQVSRADAIPQVSRPDAMHQESQTSVGSSRYVFAERCLPLGTIFLCALFALAIRPRFGCRFLRFPCCLSLCLPLRLPLRLSCGLRSGPRGILAVHIGRLMGCGTCFHALPLAARRRGGWGGGLQRRSYAEGGSCLPIGLLHALEFPALAGPRSHAEPCAATKRKQRIVGHAGDDPRACDPTFHLFLPLVVAVVAVITVVVIITIFAVILGSSGCALGG